MPGNSFYHARQAARRRAAIVTVDPSQPVLHVDAGAGRLYVSGRRAIEVQTMPGAAWNDRRRAFELSLTLETLRVMRRTLHLSSIELQGYCTDTVMKWARAAAASERVVNDLHAKLSTGYRTPLPWRDMRAGTPVGDAAFREYQVEYDANGVRVWKYRAPYEHQEVMATVACELDGAAFLCDVGTGKTRAAAEAGQYHVRAGTLDVLVVVCPNGVKPTWEREVPTYAPLLHAIALDGPLRERAATIRRDARRGTVFVINFEAFASLKTEFLALARTHKVGLVVDEMHRAKNPQAGITKALMEFVRQVRWRVGMTGTTVGNGAQDVWSQWYLIDYGTAFGANFVQFRREFFVENAYTFDLQPKRGALDEIGLRLRRRGLRYRKEDCLDLPPVIELVHGVEMSATQRRAYMQMRDTLVAQLADDDSPDDARVATAATQLTSIMRLAQITSGFLPDEQGVLHRFEPNPKLDALETLVDENIRDRKIIVWAHYREDHDAICARLARYAPRLLRGGVPLDVRRAAMRDFQEGDARLIVCQQAAAGAGIDLWASSLAIYYSQSYSLIDREQSMGRNHRGGSEIHDSITYIDLVCRDTVDEIVREALLRKTNVAEIVVDLRTHLGV